MKLRKHIFTTLLLSIGLIMHQITPGILGGMKFDFLLIFMFISIILNQDRDNYILTGILGGLLSAMTTTFPGGQLPNILDKIATTLVIYILFKLIKNTRLNSFHVGLVGGIGTLVSGTTFLTTASFIVGLPAPMKALIIGIVIPTTLVNIIGTIFVYKIVKLALRSSGSTL